MATRLNSERHIVVAVLCGAALVAGSVARSLAAEAPTKRLAGSGEAAKVAVPSLTDFWDGKATWVSDAENIGIAFGFHFPSIRPVGNEFWAFYIQNYTAAHGKFKITVGRARGRDGINWTDDGMVLDVGRAEKAKGGKTPEWDDRLASFPDVWKDGDTWYMVYEGASEDMALSAGDIGLATSKDGKTFVKHPNDPILHHETTGWERANIGTPSLYKENGVWYLFYHGYDRSVCQIGVASGKDLTKLTRSAANPILPVTPGRMAWDVGTTGRRSAIVKEGKYYYFAFEGSTSPPFEQSRWSSGLARTTNLTGRWEKFPGSPMIARTAGGFGYDGPELLRIGDTFYLYVRTLGKNSTQRFRLSSRFQGPRP